MIPKKIDLSKSIVGCIIGFAKDTGRTGFQISMLVKSRERTFDTTEEVYNLKDTEEFFPYPCLGEVLFLAQFNEEGILTYLINVNEVVSDDNLLPSALVMGTYAMFKKKIDENTKKFGEILEVQDNKVILKNYDRYLADGTIYTVLKKGNFEPHDGFILNLADDADIYLWDWSTALKPFSKCTREEAAARKYVTRMSIGTTGDFKDAYWIGFYSTRGDKDTFDLVKCFKNKAPGWE